MNIGVLSGKGGTGKTTVSTSLASLLKIDYIDCDVEEPNGFIFLDPVIKRTEAVYLNYPVIDKKTCDLCGKCISVCQFNALAKAGNEVMVFEKLCHDCGACKIVCEKKALNYEKREIGIINFGEKEEINCYNGVLNIGEPMAVPVIKQLLNSVDKKRDKIIDCPPGTSCNVVNTLKYVEYAVLVTEPSEFGLHDLKMAVEVAKKQNIHMGIIINKSDVKDKLIEEYARKSGIEILGKIPYSKDVAKKYSTGKLINNVEEIKSSLIDISLKIKEVL